MKKINCFVVLIALVFILISCSPSKNIDNSELNNGFVEDSSQNHQNETNLTLITPSKKKVTPPKTPIKTTTKQNNWWEHLKLNCNSYASATGLNLGKSSFADEKLAIIVEGDNVYTIDGEAKTLNINGVEVPTYVPENAEIRPTSDFGCWWTPNFDDNLISSVQDADVRLSSLSISVSFDDQDKFRNIGYAIYNLFSDETHIGVRYQDALNEVLSNPRKIDYDNLQTDEVKDSGKIMNGEGGAYTLVVNKNKNKLDPWYEISDTKLYLFFKKDHCLVRLQLFSSGNDQYQTYHKDEKGNPINKHPDFDHGEKEVVARAKQLASKIEFAIGDSCK